MGLMARVLGPRIPKDEYNEYRARYRLPTAFFIAAMMAILLSLLFPYWLLDLKAPQFPQGLHVKAYVNRLEGRVDPVTNSNDLEQLDALNHYVGMAGLDEGAEFERSIAVLSIVVFAGLLASAIAINSRYVVLMALPAMLFPFIFLLDLQYWLWRYGHTLDPRAPLANAVGEFTPRIFGTSKIAQFNTIAKPGTGLLLAFAAAILAALGLWFHRRAFKPLVLAAQEEQVIATSELEEGDG